jgi:hypothetical protein
MTDFHRIDSAAYVADKPVDTFALVRTHDNLKACREHRGRSATWCAGELVAGALTRPDVSGFRNRSILYFCYHLSPFVTQLTVSVRHQVSTSVAGGGVATEATLSAFAMSMSRFLTSPTLPAGSTASLTGGASSSSTTDLTIDVSDLAAGWIVVGVGVLSAEASAIQITDASGSNGPTVYRGFYCSFHVLNADAALGATSELKHWGLSLRTGAKVAELVPDVRALYLHVNTASTDSRYFLYFTGTIPSAGATGSDEGNTSSIIQHNATTDALYYIPLGVVTLDSVTISDTSVRQPTRRASLDAGSRASVRSILPEVSSGQRIWLSAPRIHHLGPQTSDNSVDLIASSTELSASGFVEFGSCLIGADDPYTINGTNLTKTSIDVQALIVVTCGVRDWNRENVFDIDFRLEATDLDGSTDAHQSDASGSTARVVALGQVRNETVGTVGHPFAMNYSDEGRLLGFAGASALPTQQTHSLRGVLPEESRYRSVMLSLPMSMVDDQVGHRRLSLQARPADLISVAGASAIADISGAHYPVGPRIHLITMTVASRPYLAEPRDLTAIGV